MFPTDNGPASVLMMQRYLHSLLLLNVLRASISYLQTVLLQELGLEVPFLCEKMFVFAASAAGSFKKKASQWQAFFFFFKPWKSLSMMHILFSIVFLAAASFSQEN